MPTHDEGVRSEGRPRQVNFLGGRVSREVFTTRALCLVQGGAQKCLLEWGPVLNKSQLSLMLLMLTRERAPRPLPHSPRPHTILPPPSLPHSILPPLHHFPLPPFSSRCISLLSPTCIQFFLPPPPPHPPLYFSLLPPTPALLLPSTIIPDVPSSPSTLFHHLPLPNLASQLSHPLGTRPGWVQPLVLAGGAL